MREITEIIKNSSKCAILPHVKADGDAIGSCLAMREVLRGLGKEAVIYSEEPVEARLEFLADDIAVVYNGGAAECDTCIALDCGDMGRLGKRAEIFDAARHTVNIDHHRTNTFFAEANHVEPELSSTGEILFKVFRYMGIALERTTARYLYAAICSDTGSFAYSNVAPDTFRIAAELISLDIDHAEISRMLFDCEDISSIKIRAELVSKMRSYYGGRLRVVTVTEADCTKYGIKPEEVQDPVNLPRGVKGTEIAAAIKYYDGKIRMSLRSNGAADVAAIALQLGGGGHTRAAGCTITDGTVDEAEARLVELCRGELDG